MIRFSHVYKTYPGPTHALRDVELEIRKGEFLFLTGPSGAGKTTLFRMLSAFDKPSSGRIEVAGHDLAGIGPKEVPYFRRRIGVIFQDFRLLRGRTVRDNVALPLAIIGERPAVALRRVNEMLELTGLLYKQDQFPDALSGGEQQRIAIARALIHKPDLLIADEPTGNLDPDLREEIMDLLDKANAQGTTVFVATHDFDLVRRRARRVIEIKGGAIARDG